MPRWMMGQRGHVNSLPNHGDQQQEIPRRIVINRRNIQLFKCVQSLGSPHLILGPLDHRKVSIIWFMVTLRGFGGWKIVGNIKIKRGPLITLSGQWIFMGQ